MAEQLAGARQDAPRRFNQVQLRAELRQRLRDWRRLLLRNVPEARALLRLMLPVPIISHLMPLASDAAIGSVRVCTLAV